MKTLFCSGTNQSCALVVRRGARRRVRHVRFSDLHLALDWCQARGVSFIWTPAGEAPAALWN